jgi:hypothetical protein
MTSEDPVFKAFSDFGIDEVRPTAPAARAAIELKNKLAQGI